MEPSQEEVAGLCTVFDSLRESEPQTACSVMKAAIANFPNCAEFRLHLADFFVAQGDYENALPHLRRAVKLEPDNLGAIKSLGLALMETGQYNESIELSLDLVRFMPGLEAAFLNRIGVLVSKIGSFGLAGIAFQKALDYEPNNVELLNNLACALIGEKRFAEAIPHLEKAVDLEPENPDFRNNLGSALVGERRFIEAIPHFEFAVKGDPENSNFRNNLGCALISRGRLAEALPHLRQAVMLDPNNRDMRLSLESAYYSLGRYANSTHHLIYALALDSKESVFKNNLGSILNHMGKPAKALPHLKLAVALDRSSVRARQNLGETFHALGRPTLAATQLRKAFALATAQGDKAERKKLRNRAKAELAKAMPSRYPHKVR